MSRIQARFADLAKAGRAGLVTFITAGDPDPITSQALLDGLPVAGADLIELGMPFSDPMADGPAIQLSSQRALANGASINTTLAMAKRFRAKDDKTPLILMGYYNPIHIRGGDAFCAEAAACGVDALIVVDLPPEEADELVIPARKHGLDFIFLTAPTTKDDRLPYVLSRASGFVYYVSVTGITGTSSATGTAIAEATARLRRHTDLPIAVGFGIRTPEQAAEVARLADAAVVGSAIVQKIASGLDENGKAKPGLVSEALGFVAELARGVQNARKGG